MKLEINKLMSSREFGELIRSEKPGFKNREDYLIFYELLRNGFDDFLKQKLEIWMFIPCKFVKGVCVVLEEPHITSYDQNAGGSERYYKELKEYQKAKDRVLFEGFRQNIYNETGSFEIIDETGFQVCVYKALPKYFLWLGCPEERNIESAMKFHDFKLTPTAKKQIGLN